MDKDFLNGLLTQEESRNPRFLTGANGSILEPEEPGKNGVNGNLAYNFKCPQSHDELLDVTKDVVVLDLPTIVRSFSVFSFRICSEND